jgi:hypothetical protein
MKSSRLSFVRFASRCFVGLAGLFTAHSALAMDEYVVYAKRAPVIHEIDRAALRGDLAQRPAAVAADTIANGVRAALADALRSDVASHEQRFASNEPLRPRA